MALLFECMGKCCRNMLDTADIVRDACLRHFVKWAIFEIVGVIEVAENKEMKSAFGSSGYRASDLQTTHRNGGKSLEVADQNDVTA